MDFWGYVKANSVVPPQRPQRIKELMQQGALGIANPLIFNYICPPGTPLALGERTNQLYRRFTNISPDEAFKRDYRLYPRLNLERGLARALKRSQTNSEYWKIVADDNPYCLYPECLIIDGERPTLAAIESYTSYAQGQLNQLLTPEVITVSTWSGLLGREMFMRMIEMYRRTSFQSLVPYLPPDVIDTELDVLVKHTQPDPSLLPAFTTFAQNVVRQYAVEGLILYEIFGDNVILAWNESTRRSNIVDPLRIANGIKALPKIFVLHEQKDGAIINNF